MSIRKLERGGVESDIIAETVASPGADTVENVRFTWDTGVTVTELYGEYGTPVVPESLIAAPPMPVRARVQERAPIINGVFLGHCMN